MANLSSTSHTAPWALHWFRRDLRICGNPALAEMHGRFAGRVLGFFCFDPEFLGRPDFAANRFGFFLQTLKALQDELRHAGGDLLVLAGTPREAFPQLMRCLDDNGTARPDVVSWNRDYEPFARQRDAGILQMLQSWGIATHTQADHLVAEPQDIQPETPGPRAYYSVYTPFSKRWFAHLESPTVQLRLEQQRRALGDPEPVRLSCRWSDLLQAPHLPEDQLQTMKTLNGSKVTIPLPPAGHKAARQAVESFLPKVGRYADDRNHPHRNGTSQLSIYLKNGSITALQVLAMLQAQALNWKDKSGLTTFVKEIAWREFYYHILWHRPDVEHQEFLEAYRGLPWKNCQEEFSRWKNGQTGFPIVDAGMRQLKETGWMHNRVRMIVASFLTKDLLIDWRWGERWFMNQLLDGDLAPNNGGWQWSASTGCDPQPYFRIFNPTLQSLKFDPEGEYIARFVPELSPLKGTPAIHEPPAAWAEKTYVLPMVDHGARRLQAMALFKRDT